MSLDKRYQVFVSSTFVDLKDERQAVAHAVLEMGHIPVGMEYWSALDEDQFDFIKRVIDQSDYYLVIVGQRYGSLTPDGLSYTEKEYDYALAKGLKVIALIQDDPGFTPKADVDQELREKLDTFRAKLSKGRLVKSWRQSGEVAANAVLGLNSAIARFPAVGWIRADRATSDKALDRILKLEQENERLASNSFLQDDDIAKPSDHHLISGAFGDGDDVDLLQAWALHTTWEAIWGLLAPVVMEYGHEDTFRPKALRRFFWASPQAAGDASPPFLTTSEAVFETLRFHFRALGYTTYEHKSDGWWWQVTDLGHNALLWARVVRTDPDKQ